jgi:urea transport system ATP-binding protein
MSTTRDSSANGEPERPARSESGRGSSRDLLHSDRTFDFSGPMQVWQGFGRDFRELTRRDRQFEFMIRAKDLELDVRHGPILYLEGLNVSFDGFKAIDELTLYVDAGELRCVIGPNGAGKTTMMDIITGKTRPDSGTAFFGQKIDLLKLSEPEIAEIGIGRKFQKPTVFEHHSVFENLELAMAADKRVFPTLFARLSGAQRDRIDEVLQAIGLTEQVHREAGALSHGQKQWLEIGMLLMQDPHLLLVDEPVAGMTHQEMERTAELLTSLAGRHSVVVVEHDMDFVRSIAKRVTVLHQGSVLAEGSMDEVQNDPRVIEVYLGE